MNISSKSDSCIRKVFVTGFSHTKPNVTVIIDEYAVHLVVTVVVDAQYMKNSHTCSYIPGPRSNGLITIIMIKLKFVLPYYYRFLLQYRLFNIYLYDENNDIH